MFGVEVLMCRAQSLIIAVDWYNAYEKLQVNYRINSAATM